VKKTKMITKRNPKTNRIGHRLLVQIRDKSQPVMRDEEGHISVPVKWIEVAEINTGSRKNPNKDVFNIRFEPIEYEKDERENNEDDNPFKRLFKGI